MAKFRLAGVRVSLGGLGHGVEGVPEVREGIARADVKPGDSIVSANHIADSFWALIVGRNAAFGNPLGNRVRLTDLLHPLHPHAQHFQVDSAGPAGHVDGRTPLRRVLATLGREAVARVVVQALWLSPRPVSTVLHRIP